MISQLAHRRQRKNGIKARSASGKLWMIDFKQLVGHRVVCTIRVDDGNIFLLL